MCLPRQTIQRLGHVGQVLLVSGAGRAGEVLPDRCVEHADRGGDPRMRRDDGGAHAQLADQVTGMQRPGAAEGDQRAFAQVHATLDADLADPAGDGGVDDPEHPGGGLVGVQGKPCGQIVQVRLSRVQVERQPAIEQRVAQTPQQHVGVGDGDLCPALAVTGGPRVGAGTVRAHAQPASGVPPGQGAAARADGVHVDRRHPQRVAVQLTGGHLVGYPVADEGDVGAGAADVEADRQRQAQMGRPSGGSDHATSQARQHGADTLLLRGLRSEQSAVGLHHPHPRGHVEVGESFLQTFQVVGDPRLHVGVDRRRRGALVLAHLPGDGGGGEHRRQPPRGRAAGRRPAARARG